LADESDTVWTSVGGFALLGCAIAALDPMAKALRVLDSGSTAWRTLARGGHGPGELQFPMAIAAGPDSTLRVMDFSRRRLITFRLDDTLVADVPLQGGIWQHAWIGRIAVAPDGRILDYWMAIARGIVIPREVFDTLPLVSVLDAAGTLLPGGWGAPRTPDPPEANILRSHLQGGDLALRGDTLFVLRSFEGTIEAFSLDAPARQPVRTIPLRRYRDAPKPEETAPVGIGRDGEMVGSGHSTAERLALALAVDAAGRFYVVSPLNDRRTPDRPWPSEALTIYDQAGSVVGQFRLRGRNTLQIAVAPGGSVVVRGHSDAEPSTAVSLQVYDAIVPQDGGRRCRWNSRPRT